MSNWFLLFVVSAIAIMALRWLVIYRYFRHLQDQTKHQSTKFPDVSVIIPCKGWDNSLPALLQQLGNQTYPASLEVIVIADDLARFQPSVTRFELPSQITLTLTTPCPADWQDKNWRLHQGLMLAQFEMTMLLDSDVTIDEDFISRRIASHHGALSFSLPLYINAKSNAIRFLTSFTNFSNLSLYGLGFALSSNALPTAIGPCIVSHIPAAELSECLKSASQQQAALDHALAYHIHQKGYTTQLADEPVTVVSDQQWSGVFNQILRWLMLSRIARHTINATLYKFILLSSMINALGLVSLVSALSLFLLQGFYSLSMTGLVLLVLLTESIGAIATERQLLAKQYKTQWFHCLFIPLVQIATPILFLISLTRSKFRWRERTIRIK